ncbi:MAG: hypothetical protein QMC59_05820 [Candidatus Poseidoniaceae archaeon]|jgi:sulfur transfer complex TusBCD TusB component (DsrH family)|tara:strand:- start:35806 stop:36318 length:513 start_codon:yes stop_codon:yes gene_type:complete
MAEQIQRVYVPSAIEDGGNTLSLGCFSSEATAWNVLRSFLKKSDQMLLVSASVVVWDIDVIGSHGLTVLASLECKDCPVCSRQTFWVDLENFSALCHGDACAAWVEESTHEPGVIDCGWPALRFLKQTKSIEEAFKELFALGDQIKAAGITDTVSIQASEAMLDEFENLT